MTHTELNDDTIMQNILFFISFFILFLT